MIKVDSKEYVGLFQFDIMHIGWEMDNDGWIGIAPDGTKVFITESHGKKYVSDVDSLQGYIDETQSVLAGLIKARDMLK